MKKDHNFQRKDETDADTDITPAEEFNTIERRMLENTDNIGNESLLVHFYKNKIEDKKNENLIKQSSHRSHKSSVPLKSRDGNI